ncbi:MAG: type II/IV secretion system protein [Sulfuricurvum sp.]|uniref:pilus assembly FimT family protein n=1 Tax=Sulfuricurvum sp. TaxID=2025608 RepID=UPI002633CBDC|nr:type II/IV secretion system protein [Sulfuricurvum sp.]MDD2830506.1 type II/IV secretion system protein [Sulfuricurvum sp.]MDD4948877.1 type II/IV secretion system protein [Sulfuricurvum sp.]
MKRTAFSMLELIFVIIVIGLLAALSIPNLNTNPLSDAAEQVANHIRYTQHLAMVDDRFDSTNANWPSELWQIRFRSVKDYNNASEKEWFYEIFSDKSFDGDSTEQEEAKDPLTGESLGNGTFNNTVDDHKLINLTRKFGIKNIVISGGTNSYDSSQPRIAFDNIGRPYRNALPNLGDDWHKLLLTSDMNITLTGSDDQTSIITVKAETGYVCILDNTTGECQGTK